jgi:hypothetical protein
VDAAARETLEVNTVSNSQFRRIASALLLATTLMPQRAAADSPDPRRESDRLYYEGKALYEEGSNIAEACAKLEQSLVLLRRGGALRALALCREAEGKPVAALALFEEAIRLAERDGDTARQQIARKQLDELQTKLSWIALAIGSGGADIPGLAIMHDGAALPQEKWSSPVAVDPGAHVIAATAPGRESFEASVAIASAGETHHVRIPVLPLLAPETPIRADTAPRLPSTPPARMPDLGHRTQLGAAARVDVDPIHHGARAAPGLTFGVHDHLEIGVSALLGRDMGVEPQLTFFLLRRSAFKPLLNTAVPVFFVNGAYPIVIVAVGVRGAVGVEWDPTRHFGVFAQVGGAYLPTLQPSYASGVFLPALGLQGRI